MVYCVVRGAPPPRAFLPRASSIRRRPCTFRTGARRIPALQICGVGAAFGHQLRQHVGIFQHGAGAQMVAVEGLALAAVVGLLEALHADGYKEITHPQHLPAELLVDEGAVGEGMEGHIPVLFTQADDVLGRGCRGALSNCIIRRIPILPAPASAVRRGRWYSFRYRSAGL